MKVHRLFGNAQSMGEFVVFDLLLRPIVGFFAYAALALMLVLVLPLRIYRMLTKVSRQQSDSVTSKVSNPIPVQIEVPQAPTAAEQRLARVLEWPGQISQAASNR